MTTETLSIRAAHGNSEAAEREEFEAWCQAEDLNVSRVVSGGNYANSGTWMAWHAWQARAALAAAPAAAPTLIPEVEAWRAARREAERKTEAYNAALIEARARDEVVGFGRTSVDAEYQAMTQASNAVIALVRPMLAALDKRGIQAPGAAP